MSQPSDFQHLVHHFFTQLLGFEPQLELTEDDDQVVIKLQVDNQDSGMLIGYRGEALNSLQLILSLVYQQQHQAWKPVRLNINDYRQKREESLQSLAQNAAAKAVNENRPITISGLSSYERRIVHSFLTNDPSVSTHSEGEPPYRTLIISPNN